ncbi:hypothetical protein [Vibrio sp. SCSIO 43136]|uniref:hypothetical protein n=1 Tax=Vibrio sp. SCSIO 43136 TaxID=2819101 RepID=UPI002075520C|nr:hypothetical protein [Vibrio sp. SCSIO 43136]USD67548.1 hypothetical protein J4N39_15215 [Vibrio sp. SCSIO 43136]
MYLVLFCHNIGMTDFSYFESEVWDIDEGFAVRGKWPNEAAFRQFLSKEFGDLSQYQVIDLIHKDFDGVEALFKQVPDEETLQSFTKLV